MNLATARAHVRIITYVGPPRVNKAIKIIGGAMIVVTTTKPMAAHINLGSNFKG
jgi:hypothetical protein